MRLKITLEILVGALAVAAQQPCDQVQCNSQFNPVCGSDGNAYLNRCQQTVANCKCDDCMTILPVCQLDCANQTSELPCGIIVDNGCKITTCGEYLDEDPCYKICESDLQPVCASNGRTYGNECSFGIAKCLSGDSLSVVKSGRCPAQTQKSITGFNALARPSTCARECTMVYNPVCASDGNVYANECVLDVAACQSEGKIEKLPDGQCLNTTQDVSYKMTSLQTSDLAACEKDCPLTSDFVCGSNGKAFFNECFFEISACRSGGDLIKAADGLCPVLTFPTPTAVPDVGNSPANNGDVCNIMCSLQYAPVCGSDGNTYANSCLLSLAACQQGLPITEAKKGECDVNEVEIAMIGVLPVAANETGMGDGAQWAYDCERECKAVYVPVCGDDGRTYPNECAFSIANCITGGSMKATNGACPPVENLQTPIVSETQSATVALKDCETECSNVLAPVCGSDGMTYMNDCLLSVANCRTGGQVTKTIDGHCIAANDTIDPCTVPCNSTLDIVCGSNGITYENECELLAASCETNVAIAIKNEGPCSEATVDVIEKPTLPYARCRDASECAKVIGGEEEDWICTDPMVCRPAQCIVDDDWHIEWCGPSQCSKASATLDMLGYCRPIIA